MAIRVALFASFSLVLISVSCGSNTNQIATSQPTFDDSSVAQLEPDTPEIDELDYGIDFLAPNTDSDYDDMENRWIVVLNQGSDDLDSLESVTFSFTKWISRSSSSSVTQSLRFR